MTVLRYLAGIVFLILGVIGLFLPILQGVFFILVGLLLLFPRNPYVWKLMESARVRYPRQTARLEDWLQEVKKKLRQARALFR
ncbi:MAG: hypothetical protein JRJ12_07670 [Deltaproteobacteria bacterium]|nr:hypothetical protein [Deltaproteobacteria bacterium]MBW2070362.1 hypothetical protein [Deltaproteobacteria bacterium]